MNPNDFPAFPVPEPCGYYTTGERKSGMTLRDWFAGMAIQAIGYHKWREWPECDVAKLCYTLADAMMAEREKQQCGEQS